MWSNFSTKYDFDNSCLILEIESGKSALTLIDLATSSSCTLLNAFKLELIGKHRKTIQIRLPFFKQSTMYDLRYSIGCFIYNNRAKVNKKVKQSESLTDSLLVKV